MIKLIDILKELSLSKHYKERKVDRVKNISDVYVSKDALGNFTLSQVKEPLIKHIQEVLGKKLHALEHQDMPLSEGYRIGYKFFIPVIETGNKQYPITLTTSEGTGNYYYVIVKDNTLVTLIISDAKDFEAEVKEHSKREYEGEPVKILEFPGAIYSVNLNKVMGVEGPKKEKPSQESVPYTVRADYRAGANFIHKDYGTGTIVNTSTGTGGKGDANGKLEWVDVDFGKDYLTTNALTKKREVTKIRRIHNVYTKTYFDYPLE